MDRFLDSSPRVQGALIVLSSSSSASSLGFSFTSHSLAVITDSWPSHQWSVGLQSLVFGPPVTDKTRREPGIEPQLGPAEPRPLPQSRPPSLLSPPAAPVSKASSVVAGAREGTMTQTASVPQPKVSQPVPTPDDLESLSSSSSSARPTSARPKSARPTPARPRTARPTPARSETARPTANRRRGRPETDDDDDDDDDDDADSRDR